MIILYIYIYIYIYHIYIYGIHFELRFFSAIQKVGQDSNPRPRASRAHALTTELSGQTMRRA